MQIADDYADIRQRLDRLHAPSPPQPNWRSACNACADSGYRQILSKQGWRRVACEVCDNPGGLP